MNLACRFVAKTPGRRRAARPTPGNCRLAPGDVVTPRTKRRQKMRQIPRDALLSRLAGGHK
jgi:hypothetical protein